MDKIAAKFRASELVPVDEPIDVEKEKEEDEEDDEAEKPKQASK